MRGWQSDQVLASLEDKSVGDPSLECMLGASLGRRRRFGHRPEEEVLADHSRLDREVDLAVDHQDRRGTIVPVKRISQRFASHETLKLACDEHMLVH